MGAKETIKHMLRAVGRSGGLAAVLSIPIVKRLLRQTSVGHLLYESGWDRVHPFDQLYGTERSSYLT
jgi:hypothetical protein